MKSLAVYSQLLHTDLLQSDVNEYITIQGEALAGEGGGIW